MKFKLYLMKISKRCCQMYVCIVNRIRKIDIHSSMYVSFVFFPFEYFSMFFLLSHNVCMYIVHIYFNVLYDDFGFFFNCMIIIISLFITLYCCLLEFRVCALFFLLMIFFCVLYLFFLYLYSLV